jgi:hypothetical protein
MPDVGELPGSGKPETPCARMHLANVSPASSLAPSEAPAALTPTPEPPHAASTNAHAATASTGANAAIERRRQGIRERMLDV